MYAMYVLGDTDVSAWVTVVTEPGVIYGSKTCISILQSCIILNITLIATEAFNIGTTHWHFLYNNTGMNMGSYNFTLNDIQVAQQHIQLGTQHTHIWLYLHFIR